MSKIFNLYENNVDKTLYQSSNIVYSECDDVTDGLKVVRVTFKDGRTYQYSDVKVNDYLLFRENVSQGKALNQYLKAYPVERVENVNVDAIIESMTNPQTEGDSNTTNVLLYNDAVVIDDNIISFDNSSQEIISQLLEKLNIKFEIKNGNQNN